MSSSAVSTTRGQIKASASVNIHLLGRVLRNLTTIREFESRNLREKSAHHSAVHTDENDLPCFIRLDDPCKNTYQGAHD